jgi:hypothetical protein
MTKEGAETAVTTSALVVAGMYTYRKLTEKAENVSGSEAKRKPGEIVKGLVGTGQLLPVGAWVTGAGITFIVLSILAAASPDLGGYSAILVATGTTLGNGLAVTQDITHSEKASEVAQAAQSAQPAQKTASLNHPPILKAKAV